MDGGQVGIARDIGEAMHSVSHGGAPLVGEGLRAASHFPVDLGLMVGGQSVDGAGDPLLKGGGTVIVAGRNEQVQKDFCEKLVAEDGFEKEKIDGSHQLDLGDLESVKKFAVFVKDTYPTVDVLICNAGVMIPMDEYRSVC